MQASNPEIPGPSPEIAPAQVNAAANACTLEWIPRRLAVHPLTNADIDSIASLGNSIHLTFFALCAGFAVSFAIVLLTLAIPDPVKHAEFVAAFGVSGILALYFGVSAAVDYRRAHRRVKEFKEGRT